MPGTFEEALGSNGALDPLAEDGVPLTQPVMNWATPVGFDGSGCQGIEV